MDRENKKLKIHLQKDWEGQQEKNKQTNKVTGTKIIYICLSQVKPTKY